MAVWKLLAGSDAEVPGTGCPVRLEPDTAPEAMLAMRTAVAGANGCVPARAGATYRCARDEHPQKGKSSEVHNADRTVYRNVTPISSVT